MSRSSAPRRSRGSELEKMGASSGSEDARVDRRVALVSAALDLFAERPYEDITVDDICARAGVAHGLLSYYFGGKRGLFAEAIRAAWAELVAFERPREHERTATEAVRGYLSRHFDYARRHPERFAIMMRTGHADEQVMEVLRSARLDALNEIALSLGCPSDAPPRLRTAIHGWSGYVDSVTLDYLDDTSALTVEDVTGMCMQVLVASVRSARDWRFDAAAELEALELVADPGGRQSA